MVFPILPLTVAVSSTPFAVARTVFRYLGYVFSFLVPRSESIWVFGAGGGNRFEGNAKYLYLHVSNNPEAVGYPVRPVWVSKNGPIVEELRERGYEAYRFSSVRALYLSLRAKYVFITHTIHDIPYMCVGRAAIVNLWHCVPIKKMSWDDRNAIHELGPLSRLQKRVMYWNYSYITTTASSLVDIFASAFRKPRERIAVTGFPRNDALFRSIPDSDIGVESQYEEKLDRTTDNQTIFGYFPTWRKEGGSLAETDFDAEALDSVLHAIDAVLVVKLHPNAQENVIFGESARIVVLPADFDLYRVLGEIDVLITDYSSIYADYLLLDRPLIFYPYDREEYEAGEREFYFDYEEYAPGPIVESFGGLCESLRETARGDGDYSEERERVRDAFFDHPDGRSTERVIEFVRALNK